MKLFEKKADHQSIFQVKWYWKRHRDEFNQIVILLCVYYSHFSIVYKFRWTRAGSCIQNILIDFIIMWLFILCGTCCMCDNKILFLFCFDCCSMHMKNKWGWQHYRIIRYKHGICTPIKSMCIAHVIMKFVMSSNGIHMRHYKKQYHECTFGFLCKVEMKNQADWFDGIWSIWSLENYYR